MNLSNDILNVLIPAYKAHNYIEHCLDSVYAQTWKGKKRVIVCIDGCELTLKKLKQIMYKYNNLTVLYCKENKGTYITLNTMLSIVEKGNILVFGADDKMHLNMIEEIMKVGKTGVVKCDGILVAPVKLVKQFGGFQPWRCAGDTEMLNRMIRKGVDVHRYPHMFTRGTHPDQVTKSDLYGHGSAVRNKYNAMIQMPRPDKIIPETNLFEYVKKPIVSFNIATYPAREKYLKQVIEDVYNKVDIIRVCLNEYSNIPRWLKKDKIHAVIPNKNLKDKGKFIWSKHTKDEIYFTGDDDLLYSDDYFKNHLEYLSRYDAIISSHGRILKDKAKDLTDCIEYVACLKNQDKDLQVNIAGTGVMAFDLSKFTVDIDKIPCEGMADIGVAIYAGQNNIPLIARKHDKNELKYILENGETLWETNKKKKYETLLKKIKPVDKIELKEKSEFKGSVFEVIHQREIAPKNYLIKSYVINLESQPERLKEFKAQNNGLNNIIVRPIPLNNSEVQRQMLKLIRAGACNNELKRLKEVSNRLTFANILNRENDDKIIIFEDDVIFEPDFYRELNKVLSQLPDDFGICWLGAYFRRPVNLKKYSTNLLELLDREYVVGAHAIIYNKSVYQKIGHALLKVRSKITDFEISEQLLGEYKCFVANPMLCYQKQPDETAMHRLDFNRMKAENCRFMNII